MRKITNCFWNIYCCIVVGLGFGVDVVHFSVMFDTGVNDESDVDVGAAHASLIMVFVP